jgi:predicted dehydrogenase
MNKLKLAIIGTGRISPNHIVAAQENSDSIDLVAICDLLPENMDKALKKVNYQDTVKKYIDYKEMILTEKLDIVAIATDSGKHAEIGLFCLQHGCHCIIEKPIAMSISDADHLIALAAEKHLTLAACHQNRFNKSIQKVRKALDDGRFGRVSHIAANVRWNRNKDYYLQAPWRGKWESDGGCLMNQCIHNADLVVWMLGDIEEVFAYTAQQTHNYIEGEDLGLALIKGKNNAYAIFEGTVNVYPKNLEETLYVFGEKGTVKVAGTSVNLIDKWEFADHLDESDTIIEECKETPPNVYGFGHARLYADVIQAINNGTKPLVDGEQGKKALELILAIYKSKKTGLPVRLPLKDFESKDMEGTF